MLRGERVGQAKDTFEGTKIAFDPANFVDPRLDTNLFHPLKPGMQWVRGGTTEVGSRVVPHEVITTMTDVIRIIDGVPTIAMLDESTDSRDVSLVTVLRPLFVLSPSYSIPTAALVTPVLLGLAATLAAAIAGSRLVNRLDPTELLRDE